MLALAWHSCKGMPTETPTGDHPLNQLLPVFERICRAYSEEFGTLVSRKYDEARGCSASLAVIIRFWFCHRWSKSPGEARNSSYSLLEQTGSDPEGVEPVAVLARKHSRCSLTMGRAAHVVFNVVNRRRFERPKHSWTTQGNKTGGNRTWSKTPSEFIPASAGVYFRCRCARMC